MVRDRPRAGSLGADFKGWSTRNLRGPACDCNRIAEVAVARAGRAGRIPSEPVATTVGFATTVGTVESPTIVVKGFLVAAGAARGLVIEMGTTSGGGRVERLGTGGME